MRTALVFSDVHCGIDGEIIENNQDLLELITTKLAKDIAKGKRELADYIVLAGDVIESWYTPVYKLMPTYKPFLDSVFERFEKLGKERIYIVGNHDSVEVSGELPDQVKEYLLARGWIICQEFTLPGTYISHGHRGEYGKITTFLASMAIRAVYFLSRYLRPIFGKVIDKIKNPVAELLDAKLKDPTSDETLAYYRQVLKRHKGSSAYPLKVFGHTHIPLIVDQLGVINTGDWVEDATFVEIVTDEKLCTAVGYKASYGKPIKIEQIHSISCDLD